MRKTTVASTLHRRIAASSSQNNRCGAVSKRLTSFSSASAKNPAFSRNGTMDTMEMGETRRTQKENSKRELNGNKVLRTKFFLSAFSGGWQDKKRACVCQELVAFF
jgi:hypothetical protein